MKESFAWSEVYSEPYQTSKMRPLEKLVTMNYIHKDSILDLSQDSDTRLQVKKKFVFQNRLVQKIYKNHKSKIIGLSPQLW